MHYAQKPSPEQEAKLAKFVQQFYDLQETNSTNEHLTSSN